MSLRLLAVLALIAITSIVTADNSFSPRIQRRDSTKKPLAIHNGALKRAAALPFREPNPDVIDPVIRPGGREHEPPEGGHEPEIEGGDGGHRDADGPNSSTSEITFQHRTSTVVVVYTRTPIATRTVSQEFLGHKVPAEVIHYSIYPVATLAANVTAAPPSAAHADYGVGLTFIAFVTCGVIAFVL